MCFVSTKKGKKKKKIRRCIKNYFEMRMIFKGLWEDNLCNNLQFEKVSSPNLRGILAWASKARPISIKWGCLCSNPRQIMRQLITFVWWYQILSTLSFMAGKSIFSKIYLIQSQSKLFFRIPILLRPRLVKLIWMKNTKGAFSVRSAYMAS